MIPKFCIEIRVEHKHGPACIQIYKEFFSIYLPYFVKVQKVPGRINCLLSFDTTMTAQKGKKRNKGTPRQQGDLLSLLIKIRGGYIDRKGYAVA
jgi:hypothetical protein